MIPDIKSSIVADGVITEDQLRAAESQAREENSSVESVLNRTGVLEHEVLGRYLSSKYKMPYVSLSDSEISEDILSLISRDCAWRWRVFPINRNHGMSVVTLVVSDPDHGARIDKIYDFMLEPYNVAFTIASWGEIEDALLRTVGEPEDRAVLEVDKHGQISPVSSPGTKVKLSISDQASTKKKGHKPAKPSIVAKPAEQWPSAKGDSDSTFGGGANEEMDRALVSAVSLMVAAHLGGDARQLARIRTRARYCQLLAARLGLGAEQRIKTILAAWVSALSERRDVIRQLATPFDLESIVFAEESGYRGKEAGIIELVRSYQEYEQEAGQEARDVNMVRRQLLVRSSAASQTELLETFLQVLMDEQFLGEFDEAAGEVLLIDPAAAVASEVGDPLEKAGYRVTVLADVKEAVEAAAQSRPDVVIAHAAVSAKDILGLCRKIGQGEGGHKIPIIVLLPAGSEIRGAEFLRAGADDFLLTPVDLELLYLKVEKQMASAPADEGEAKRGVTGTLDDMSFSDMIQVLSAGCKSTRITVSNNGEDGELLMKDGNVVHAKLGDAIGERAFYIIMQWESGDFTMEECNDFPDATISSSTMSLLMEGARLVDEGIAP